MTIGSQLDALAAAKAAIKTSIEGKGVAVGNAPLSQYASKIDAITVGEGGGPAETDPVPLPVNPWVRNPYWLPMPEMPAGENRIHILLAVYPYANKFAISRSGSVMDVNVDWGDGTSNSYSSHSSAEYEYNYDSLPQVEGSTLPYKQVIITITTNTPESSILNTIRIARTSDQTNTTGDYSHHVLDMHVQTRGATTGSLGMSWSTSVGSGVVLPKAILLERLRINFLSESTVPLSYLAANAYSLRVCEITGPVKPTACDNMFLNCGSLEEVPTIDTSNCTNFSYMFSGCASLRVPPTLNTSNALDVAYMFSDCRTIVEVKGLDTSKVNSIAGLFNNCTALRRVPPIDTSRATSISRLFSGCSNLVSFPDLVTDICEDFSNSFQNGSFVVAPILSSTANGKNFDYMYLQCANLSNIPNFDFSNAESFSNTFNGCKSIREIGDLNLPKVTNLTYAFANCSSALSFRSIYAPLCTNATYLFYSCTNLQQMPVLTFAPNCSISYFLYNCSSIVFMKIESGYYLKTVPLGAIQNCTSLIRVDISNFSNDGVGFQSNTNWFSSSGNITYVKTGNTKHTGTCASFSITNTQIQLPVITEMIDNIGCVNSGATPYFILGNSPGAIKNPAISRSVNSTIGSNVVTASSASLSVGYFLSHAHATTITLATTSGSPTLTSTRNHGFGVGDLIYPNVNGGGLAPKQCYEVVAATETTLELKNFITGQPFVATGSGSYVCRYSNWITDISGTTITLKYPVNATSSAASGSFRTFDAALPTFKGWSLTG